jgi:hypothetical protein
MFLERLVQKVHPGKWVELEALDKKYDVIEGKYGFPPKKRYQATIGGGDSNTLIIQRDWPSLAAMETAYMACMADPAWQALAAESTDILENTVREVYLELP